MNDWAMLAPPYNAKALAKCEMTFVRARSERKQ